MVSSIRQGRGVENAGGAVAWLRARPWLYAYVVLSLWAIVPGLRRIVDWKSSFSSVSIVSIVPLLSLIPAAAILFGWSRGTKDLSIEEYDNLYKRFDPEKFNADDWVSVARAAGMSPARTWAMAC